MQVARSRHHETAAPRPARLFTREIAHERSSFDQHGYAVLRGFMGPEFLKYCDERLRACLADEALGRHIPGKKSQFVFPWPSVPELRTELFGTVAQLLRCAADHVVLSERHFHVYAADAPARPLPHQDRAASQIAIGIPLDTAERSELVLFLDGRASNPLEQAVGLRRALGGSDQAVADFMRRTPAVHLQPRRGDAVIFLGSSIFHERYDAAGTVILYLKLNKLGLDPLGEHLSAG